MQQLADDIGAEQWDIAGMDEHGVALRQPFQSCLNASGAPRYRIGVREQGGFTASTSSLEDRHLLRSHDDMHRAATASPKCCD
jgi:hypothetical protein